MLLNILVLVIDYIDLKIVNNKVFQSPKIILEIARLIGKHRVTVSRWCGMHWAERNWDFKSQLRSVE